MLAVCSFIFDHPIYVYICIYTHKQFYDSALDSVSRWRSDLAINPFIDIYFCANDRIRVCLLCSGRKKSLREVSFIIGSLFGQRNKIAIFFFFFRSKFKRRLNLSYFFFFFNLDRYYFENSWEENHFSCLETASFYNATLFHFANIPLFSFFYASFKSLQLQFREKKNGIWLGYIVKEMFLWTFEFYDVDFNS